MPYVACIKLKNQTQKDITREVLEKRGYKLYAKNTPDWDFWVINDKNEILGTSIYETQFKGLYEFHELDEFVNFLTAPKFIEVKLNAGNTAKVFSNKIVVGCQEFPISIVNDLDAALKKINNP